jgi:UDP-glucose 4-epimerase
VPRSIEDPVSTNHACVSGTLQLLLAAKNAKVRRVVYAGSSSVYGNVPTLPKSEQMLPQPISPYAVAKLACEYYLQSFASVYGLETVTIRYFNVFGPHQDPTSHYSGVLAIFSLKMLAGETPTIYGDGEQSRDFTFIQNVVHANLLASEAPAEKVSGKVFNVATGNRITLNQAGEVLRQATGYSGKILYAPERGGDVKHSLADISRAKECFGYEPLIDFREGIERTVTWYKSITNFA